MAIFYVLCTLPKRKEKKAQPQIVISHGFSFALYTQSFLELPSKSCAPSSTPGTTVLGTGRLLPVPLALMEVGAGRLPVRSQRAWEGQAGNDPHLCPCWSPSAPSPLPVEALLPSTGRPGPALFGERACPWRHMLSVVLKPPSLGRIHFPLTLRRGFLLPLSPLTPVRKELMVKEGSGGHSDRARTRGHRERGRPKMA